MRKILVWAALGLSMILIPGCGGSRSQVLKVYNWFNYIDPTVIPEFEAWYKQQTGETVKVQYKEYETNHELLSALENDNKDYDVVSPSDYIVERMLNNNAILPIDMNFGNTPNYISLTAPFLKEHFKGLSKDVDANQFAVANMWGTTGILYNADYVKDGDSHTWNIIRNFKYRDRILVKDSPRDVYSQIILAVKDKDIQKGLVTPQELMYYTGEENIALVEQFLMNVKELVLSWDAADDKNKMVEEEGYVDLTWNGEAVQAIEEAAQYGVMLRFSLPDEGFTLWFDGWVIPKNAVNVKAARYWINFMCKPDIVIRNSDVTGYVSGCGSSDVLEHFIDNRFPVRDLSYFFGPGADSVRVNPVMFPDKSEIARSVIEHDWGDNTQLLHDMWARVTGEECHNTFWYFCGIFVLVGGGVFAFLRRKRVSVQLKTRKK